MSVQSSWQQQGPWRRHRLAASLAAAALLASLGALRLSAWTLDRDRIIRLHELAAHGVDAERIWVCRGTTVYDITDFIPMHPGGEIILQAAGAQVDPFWKIFTLHQKPEVYDILEEYRIGTIHPDDLVDGQVPADTVRNPFVNDPTRDPRLIQHTTTPCNAETPGALLEGFITPTELFFVRNHFWVPDQLHPDEHTLTIELFDGTEKSYTVAELRKKFPQTTITATLQCSGNRRSHMSRAKPTIGLAWDRGAIGNAVWSGVLLSDVLKDCGVDVDAVLNQQQQRTGNQPSHVHFFGSEAYGASIPIRKALLPGNDVLLATEMNGKQIPPDHGFPLRVIVPGHIAARSVKWLKKIALSDEESYAQWQRRDYKCFGPNEKQEDIDWEKDAVSIQELPIQSAITKVDMLNGSQPDGDVKLSGYAISGGGRSIIRIDLSVDGGLTWKRAHLEPDEAKGNGRWSWTKWNLAVKRKDIHGEVVVKAIDDAYNAQPERFDAIWNFRGNLANAWDKQSVDI